MPNFNLDKLISQLNKIKKQLDYIDKTPAEIIALKPYEFDNQLTELRKTLTSTPFIELLGETSLYNEIKNFCEQEQQKVNKFKEEFHFGLGTQLKELFAGFGELKGQLPVLRIKFYTIRFDFSNGETIIWWGPEKEMVKKVSLEPETICQTIKSFDDALIVFWENSVDFTNIVKSAYQRYIKINNLESGTKIGLLEILTECVMLMQSQTFKSDPTKSHFTDYSRIQYSFDLFKMKTTAPQQNFQLTVATFAITEDRTKSLWVPDNEQGDGTYYQSIAFKE
jgi:hypothetical protein